MQRTGAAVTVFVFESRRGAAPAVDRHYVIRLLRMSLADRNLDYSSMSILIGILRLAWFFAPRPFDPYKHHSVGTVIAIVAMGFAVAGFRLGNRRHAWIGLSIGLFSFCGYLLIVPL